MDISIKCNILCIVLVLLIVAFIYCMIKYSSKGCLRKNWISIFPILFSLIALANCYPRTEKLGFDYLGVIVGILALLFTVLIGLQIFNTVSFERKIKKFIIEELRTQENKIDTKLNIESEIQSIKINNAKEMITDVSNRAKSIAICISLSNLGYVLYQNKDYKNAIITLFNALGAWNKQIQEEREIKEAYKKTIYILKEMMKMNIGLELEKEGIDIYIKIAQRTEDEDIIRYAYSLKEKKCSSASANKLTTKEIVNSK